MEQGCASVGGSPRRAYVLKVCYYLLFGAVGRTGSSLDLGLGNAGVSRWISETAHDPTFGDGGPSAGGGRAAWWSRGLLAFESGAGQGMDGLPVSGHAAAAAAAG